MSQDHPREPNDHQDPDVAAMLSRIRPPEHGDDFWPTLRSDLQAAARATPAPEATAVQEGGGDTAVPVHPTRGNGHGPGPGRDWRRWTLMAAAAVVVVALIGGGYLALRDGDDISVITPPDPSPTVPSPPDTDSTTPTITEESADTTTEDSLPSPQGGPIDRGPGRVVAVDPSSSFVYIADAAPEGGQGCEGAPRGALYVEPIDGGERTLIADAETIDATTPVKMRFDGDGGVAVATQCEGQIGRIYTATIDSDGAFSDINEVTLPGVNLTRDEPADRILDVAFREPGVLVAATLTTTVTPGGDEETYRRLWEFQADDSSELEHLGVDDAQLIDTDPQGRLAIYSENQRLRYEGNDQVSYAVDGFVNDIRISDSGGLLAVTGESETAVIDLATGETKSRIAVNGFTINHVDENLLIFERFNQGTSTAVAVDPNALDADQIDLVDGEPFGIVVAPDLSRVFATQATADGSAVNVVEQRLERR